MRVLVIEDEDLAAKRLIQLLKEYELQMEIDGPIDTVKQSVTHLLKDSLYDVVFMDIQLADGKSFSIFPELDFDTPVIFTTAYDEYAIKAFEHNSIDYLLKPISKEKLQNSIEKLRKIKTYYEGKSNEQIAGLLKSLQIPSVQTYKTRFLVNGGNSLIPISTSEIAYFAANDKVVQLTTHSGKNFIISHTLDELETKLNPIEFFRVNRQFFVNISAIKKVHNYFNYKLKLEIIQQPEIEIIVSKQRVQSFKNWMNND